MRVTGLRVCVERPHSQDFCLYEDEKAMRTNDFQRLADMQRAQSLLINERDCHRPEQEHIDDLRSKICAREKDLQELVKNLEKCQGTCPLSWSKHHRVIRTREEELAPEIRKLLNCPLGRQYIEATWWLAHDGSRPQLFGTHELTVSCAQHFMCDAREHIQHAGITELADYDRKCDQMIAAMTVRYSALQRVFLDVNSAASECGVDWPVFENQENKTSEIADWITLEAVDAGVSASPHVAEALRIILPIQQQERRLLAALGELVCSRDRFMKCAREAAGLIGVCHSHTLEMNKAEQKLDELAHAASTASDVKQADQVRRDIGELKVTLRSIECQLAHRRMLLDDKIADLEFRIRELACSPGCAANNTADDDSCPDSVPVIGVSAPCGHTLVVDIPFVEPGFASEHTVSVFARHEKRIYDTKAELEQLKAKQAAWVESSIRGDGLPSAELVAALTDVERPEWERAKKQAGRATASAAAVHAMIGYWARVISNLQMQLARAIETQSVGIVRDVCALSNVQWRNFDWSDQGLYTFKIVDCQHGGVIHYANLALSVSPNADHGWQTYEEWRQHMLKATYTAPSSAPAKEKFVGPPAEALPMQAGSVTPLPVGLNIKPDMPPTEKAAYAEINGWLDTKQTKRIEWKGWEGVVTSGKVQDWNVWVVPENTVFWKGVDASTPGDSFVRPGVDDAMWFGNLNVAIMYGFLGQRRVSNPGKVICGTNGGKVIYLLKALDSENLARLETMKMPDDTRFALNFAFGKKDAVRRLSQLAIDMQVSEWLCSNLPQEIYGWGHMKQPKIWGEIMLCSRTLSSMQRLPLEIRAFPTKNQVMLVRNGTAIHWWDAKKWNMRFGGTERYKPDPNSPHDAWIIKKKQDKKEKGKEPATGALLEMEPEPMQMLYSAEAFAPAVGTFPAKLVTSTPIPTEEYATKLMEAWIRESAGKSPQSQFSTPDEFLAAARQKPQTRWLAEQVSAMRHESILDSVESSAELCAEIKSSETWTDFFESDVFPITGCPKELTTLSSDGLFDAGVWISTPKYGYEKLAVTPQAFRQLQQVEDTGFFVESKSVSQSIRRDLYAIRRSRLSFGWWVEVPASTRPAATMSFIDVHMPTPSMGEITVMSGAFASLGEEMTLLTGDDCDDAGSGPDELTLARWDSKLARSVQRMLWSKYPDFSLAFFTQCDYSQLQCAIDDRAVNRRWSSEELAEVRATGLGVSRDDINLSMWLQDVLRSIRSDIKAARAIENMHQHGPVVIEWFHRVSGAWAMLMDAVAALDGYLDGIKCNVDPVVFKPEILRRAEVLKEAMVSFQVPRCPVTHEDIEKLLEALRASDGSLLVSWRLLVKAYEVMIHIFNVDPVWKTAFGTCQPVALMEMLDVAAASDDNLAAALNQLQALLASWYIPALINWLQFSLDDEVSGFGKGKCIDSLLTDNRTQLHGRVEVINANRSKLLERAATGEQMALSYKLLLNPDGGILGVIAKVAREVLPRLPAVQELKHTQANLVIRYLTDDIKEWNRRVDESGFSEYDTVTGGMGIFADRWTRNPMTDAEMAMQMLSQSTLFRPGFDHWSKHVSEWFLSYMRTLSKADDGDWIKTCFSDIRVVEFMRYNSGLLLSNEVVPTMASLVCAYRDGYATDDNQLTLTLLSKRYLAVEYAVAMRYTSLAKGLYDLLGAVYEDVVSLRLCLGKLDIKAMPSIEDSMCLLRKNLMHVAEGADLFKQTLFYWGHMRRLSNTRNYHNELAIYRNTPWLEKKCGSAWTTEHRWAMEFASRIFKLRESGPALSILDRWSDLGKFLEAHYVCVPEPSDVCPADTGYTPAVHEFALSATVITSLNTTPLLDDWRGRPHEREWREFGVTVWDRYLELQESLVAMAFDSPGCFSGVASPAESWENRSHDLEDFNVSLLSKNMSAEQALLAVNSYMTAIFNVYAALAKLVEEEFGRENAIASGSRVSTVPEIIYGMGKTILPGAFRYQFDEHLPFKPREVPPVMASSVHTGIIGVGAQALVRTLPYVTDPSAAPSDEFPMNEVSLAIGFYNWTNGAQLDTPSSAAEVLSLLRNHAARRAIRLTVHPDEPDYRLVPVGTLTNRRDSYFDSLGSFFWNAYARDPATYSDFVMAPEVFGNVIDRAVGRHAKFSEFIAGESNRNQYDAAVNKALRTLSRSPLLSAATILDRDAAATWSNVREALWVLALTETLEGKIWGGHAWFVSEFIPSVAVLESMFNANGKLSELSRDVRQVATVNNATATFIAADPLVTIAWLVSMVEGNTVRPASSDQLQARYVHYATTKKQIEQLREAAKRIKGDGSADGAGYDDDDDEDGLKMTSAFLPGTSKGARMVLAASAGILL